ncbi:hypothetical protein D0C36_01565 [Mucilaginibacter conchicola]|uniref:Uncharacterized protein n=1 Tax=Mucilaginibacter conchicola TaxID=2303333 RepID=A0A372NWN0_9SPHI|nr:hypothetical protein [Mucilaginibacter conchicola]RFZ94271.1 hypothetical protein D0C36_01565 [Mucilaginibacter conchicola]
MRSAPPPPRPYVRRREAPPSRDYLKDKKVKKKTAKKAAWLIVLAFVVFGVFLAKFALSDSNVSFDGLPDSDTAYGIARQFIQPTIRATNVRFSDDRYKFAKQSDSIYVIKSSYNTKYDDGENLTTNFTITLKYRGGMGTKIGNWNMVSLDQDN